MAGGRLAHIASNGNKLIHTPTTPTQIKSNEANSRPLLKLPTPDAAEKMKAYWAEKLEALRAFLEK